MKISSKGRYALRMLLDLAEHNNGRYISLTDISERQNISKKYLEQIIPVLSKTDILCTFRGSQGGYRLAKDPDKYTVGEILRLTERTLSPVSREEMSADEGGRGNDSYMSPTWIGLDRVINEYLDSITLQDILDQAHGQYDYVI